MDVPQMLARVGFGIERAGPSPRRDLAQLTQAQRRVAFGPFKWGCVVRLCHAHHP